MPLAHFTNIKTATCHTGTPIYLSEKILCFDEHESKWRLTFSKNFFNLYPFSDKEKEKYLNEYKSVTFQESDDDFVKKLLDKKPSELKMVVHDKEGNVIRELKMFETEYKVSEFNELEVELRFKNYEDKYF